MSVPALSDGYEPDLRSAATVQLFADNQMGFRPQFSDNWNMRGAYDSMMLSPYVGLRANAGDCIEWSTAAPEDASYKAFRQAVQADGVPYIDTPGNHDLTTYNNAATFPYTRTTADGIAERMTRSADEWASKVAGRAKANTVIQNGDIAVIAVSPDWWPYRASIPGFGPPDPLSEEILGWLDGQLTALGTKPTWMVSHAIPLGQFSTTTAKDTEFLRPWPRITEVLGAHSNALGWLSGHWHIAPSNGESIKTLPAGPRSIVSINAPSSQGIRSGWSAAQQQYGDGTQGPEYMKSMFISYDGTSITARWRDHNAAAWVQPFGGKYKRITP